MRNALGLGIAIALATAAPVGSIAAQDNAAAANYAVRYSAEELENLLAPVALYPDPILAQVLVAASYPDEVDLAARHIAVYGSTNIDGQPWDISVKALAHYAPVLNLMADRPDWTVALGQAYATQPQGVMDAVQSLRGIARSHGNLATTAEQRVVVEDRYIRILPARPQVVYVPVYDPYVVYYQPVMQLGVYRRGWSFGAAFPIGGWLTYDVDWHHRHVYYHGWDTHRYRSGWFVHSRPFIVVNHIYVHRGPRIVVVNHRVINRGVHWDRMGRYNYLHRQVAWERDGRRAPRGYVAGADRRGGRDDDRRGGRDDDDRGRNPSWDRSGRGVGRVVDAAPQRTAQPRRAEATTASTTRPTARPQATATRAAETRSPTRAQATAATRPAAGDRQPSWNPRGNATARPATSTARSSNSPARSAPVATRQTAPRQTGGTVQRAPQQPRPQAASQGQVTRAQASRPQAAPRSQASQPQQPRPQASTRTQSAPRAQSAPQGRSSGAASSNSSGASRGGSAARGSSGSRRQD